MTDAPQKILFVINQGSGKKNGTDWLAAVQDHFKTLHHNTRIFIMPKNNARPALQKLMAEFLPQKIVAVGGDGTVTFVANEVLGKNIQMGILPAGSANGMAKELQIPVDPEKAIQIVLSGEVKKTDVIRINNERICLHLSDVGINAQIVKYFQDGPVRGKIGYAIALVKALRRKHRLSVSVESKDADIHRKAIMVLIANASKYGTGATINPLGDISDGYFEVVIVRKIGIIEIFKMFLRFQRFNPKNIEVISAKSAVIETRYRSHFQVDGEYLGKVTKVTAKIVAGQLDLLVPVVTD